MNDEIIPGIAPLPFKHRRSMFFLLFILFVMVLPFLYLYATGYRFDFGNGETTLVSTGGIIVGAERTGATLYVDGEQVSERRTFTRAFYAQGLTPGTHHVYVQKDGAHTWVKELPVYPHLVTEAQAFNMPLVPDLRVISPWKDAQSVTVLFASTTLIASTTNNVRVATTTKTKSLIADTEFISLKAVFEGPATSTASSSIAVIGTSKSASKILTSTTTATTTADIATTTKEWQGVRLYEYGEDVYAKWIGSRDDMPYYYCAEDFPRYLTSTEPIAPVTKSTTTQQDLALVANTSELIGPVQSIPEDVICEPVIRLDRKWQNIRAFDFLPGSTDHIILALDDGVYVVEVDDRAWQNVQPLIMGDNLDMKVVNGNVYLYDGTLVYNVILTS